LSTSLLFFLSLQQELGEAVAAAQRRFYDKYPDPQDWTSKSVDDWVSSAVKKVEDKFQAELKKHLLVADPKHTSTFLEQIKVHYEMNDEAPEMNDEAPEMQQ